MEYQTLINSEKKNVHFNSTRYLYLVLSVIVILQIFTITYLILLGKFALDFNLFNVNITETNEYVDKFKHIINYICGKMVNCS